MALNHITILGGHLSLFHFYSFPCFLLYSALYLSCLFWQKSSWTRTWIFFFFSPFKFVLGITSIGFGYGIILCICLLMCHWFSQQNSLFILANKISLLMELTKCTRCTKSCWGLFSLALSVVCNHPILVHCINQSQQTIYSVICQFSLYQSPWLCILRYC